MVPFWIPVIIRHLIFKVPKNSTIILTTIHVQKGMPGAGLSGDAAAPVSTIVLTPIPLTNPYSNLLYNPLDNPSCGV